MVGGFSESPFLKAEIKKAFENQAEGPESLHVLVPSRPQVSVIRPKDSFMGWECINGTQLEARTHMNLKTNIYNADYLYV